MGAHDGRTQSVRAREPLEPFFYSFCIFTFFLVYVCFMFLFFLFLFSLSSFFFYFYVFIYLLLLFFQKDSIMKIILKKIAAPPLSPPHPSFLSKIWAARRKRAKKKKKKKTWYYPWAVRRKRAEKNLAKKGRFCHRKSRARFRRGKRSAERPPTDPRTH